MAGRGGGFVLWTAELPRGRREEESSAGCHSAEREIFPLYQFMLCIAPCQNKTLIAQDPLPQLPPPLFLGTILCYFCNECHLIAIIKEYP